MPPTGKRVVSAPILPLVVGVQLFEFANKQKRLGNTTRIIAVKGVGDDMFNLARKPGLVNFRSQHNKTVAYGGGFGAIYDASQGNFGEQITIWP